MKKVLYILILFMVCSIESCKENKEQLPLFDFGSETFDEPFVGLLSSRPNILVKSLEYPPFSWLMSDTVSFSKDLEIEFNEDGVRSKSEAYIQFSDTLFSPIEGVEIAINGKRYKSEAIIFKADSILKECKIELSVPPIFGDTTLIGYVLVKGNELDIANDIDLQNSNNIIAKWECHYQTGWPILIWLLWFLLSLIFILATLLPVYAILRLLYFIPSTISMVNMIGKTGVCKMSFGEILKIKFKTGWSNEAIQWIENKNIANIYIQRNLKETVVGNRRALIDPKLKGNMIDEGTSDKHTNKVTMSRGGQPLIEYKGEINSMELHHSGQDPNSLLVELPYSVHKEYYKTLHTNLTCSKIDRQEFARIKKEYWKARSKMF